MASIRNEQPTMEYRRFGKTERRLSVITLGGMRYHKGWDKPRDELPEQTLEECRRTLQRGFDLGLNHIETAYGYVKSEHCHGKVLNEILQAPRESYYLMTKGDSSTASDMRRRVESQLEALQTDHIDFYGWHGINTPKLLKVACARRGPVRELHRMQDEGIIGHVGFSTHGPLNVVLDAIRTDLFEFVNLHYYYFLQRNAVAIAEAADRDMGVFVISPNDKGGRLYSDYPLLRRITAPSTPIQFNARFCLGSPAVHTLSFGLHEESHFDEMLGIFPTSTPLSQNDAAVAAELDGRRALDAVGVLDLAHLRDHRSGMNVPELLRLRSLWKCYEMTEYVRYRYGCFGKEGHWYAGQPANPKNLGKLRAKECPKGVDLHALLAELHAEFGEGGSSGA